MLKKIRLLAFLSLIVILILSCENQKNTKEKSTLDDALETVEIYINNNKAIENWEKFFNKSTIFTYQIEEFISYYKDSLLYFNCSILDIIKNDSGYKCILYVFDKHFNYLELTCTKQQVDSMVEIDPNNEWFGVFGILLYVNKFSNLKYYVYEDGYEEYHEIEIELNRSGTLHGKMIDFIFIQSTGYYVDNMTQKFK